MLILGFWFVKTCWIQKKTSSWFVSLTLGIKNNQPMFRIPKKSAPLYLFLCILCILCIILCVCVCVWWKVKKEGYFLLRINNKYRKVQVWYIYFYIVYVYPPNNFFFLQKNYSTLCFFSLQKGILFWTILFVWVKKYKRRDMSFLKIRN